MTVELQSGTAMQDHAIVRSQDATAAVGVGGEMMKVVETMVVRSLWVDSSVRS